MAIDSWTESEVDGIIYPTLGARLDAIDAKLAGGGGPTSYWISPSDLSIAPLVATEGSVNAGFPVMNCPTGFISALSATVHSSHVSGWPNIGVELWWTNNGAGAGAVDWASAYSIVGDGSDLSASGTSLGISTTVAPAQLILEVTSLGIIPGPVPANRIIGTGVIRGAADTLPNDAAVLGLRLHRLP